MIEKNCKAELQHLQYIYNSFLCDVYLKAKLDKFLNSMDYFIFEKIKNANMPNIAKRMLR